MKNEFDNKYLIAYLCHSKSVEDFKVLLDFYRFLSNLFYKTKDYNLYQIKLQWLLEELFIPKDSGIFEVDKFKILMQKYLFTKENIIKMIEAKAIDMDNFPFSSQEDLLKYIENTDLIFWNLYAEIVFGKQLSLQQIELINNMAKAFGIVELIKFAEFKKKRGVYVLLYSKDDMGEVLKIEKQNIQNLSKIAEQYIAKSSKNKGKLRKLLLLNYFSKDFLKNLSANNFQINNIDTHKTAKATYLKIILSLIFRV
ncbi:MAG: hypothetical protein LBH40_05015 [Alphaproteobacteria bacterium]|jgi:hypothetical protein|nr:hypothetical protein [Alphaproteobacteria bacterium]